MSILVNTVFDLGGANRLTNLAAAVAVGQPVTYEQLNAAVANIAWKDNIRVASQVDVTIASPGATIDGITMSINDRVLVKAQTTVAENGIYIWNGAATPLTRAADAATFADLESAVTTVDEGTDAGVTYRQTQVNGTIDTNDVIWTDFGTASPSASESTPGIAEIATQTETDTGTDDARFVTPLKLATYAGRAKRYSTTIGDASATSIAVTHNLGTDDVQVYIREVGGSKRQVIAEVQHTGTNSVTVLFDAAPALNSMRVTVQA
ncbi:MAG: hypothetical protein M0R47_19895 [Methylobacter sp.]|uniref:hypothetical protein n=1 Tax=Methylobacter sp. TaxID=2051955 RepID=UPI0025EAA0B2|nr:hypothetical protein [Methylobacter sp.]MCK9622785.1 hypothetical protein [Methylobacter sp.]